MSSKTEMLLEMLEDLNRASQGNVQASLIISTSQGLPICTHYPEGVDTGLVPDEDVISGRSMQIQDSTSRVFKELKRGTFVRMLVEGEQGYVIISGAGDDALLAVLTNKKVNLGYMFFMMTRVARRIETIL
ncbi:MAG: roadblock/LC7 domain-containing protein [Candidatus Thorarchaeota archaeon]